MILIVLKHFLKHIFLDRHFHVCFYSSFLYVFIFFSRQTVYSQAFRVCFIFYQSYCIAHQIISACILRYTSNNLNYIYIIMRDLIVGVKCKLTDSEIARHSYGHCVSHCRFRVSKPNKKHKPIFQKLPCIFISLLSRLGKTYDYIALKLFFFFL